MSTIASFGDIFRSEIKRDDEEEIWSHTEGVLAEALDSFVAMRKREGGRIEEDLRARINYMKSLVERIDERSPQIVEEYKNRLYSKIKEILDGAELDDSRILTEVAIFADKEAVNEEKVRL